MKVNEIILELTYFGRPCTKDCSGHRAGYKWASKHNVLDPIITKSPSFDDGADIGRINRQRKSRINRDGKGR